MDLFKFNNVSAWRNGEAVNGWDRLTWVERYRDPGEFELECELSSGLRAVLPLGTLISHSETLEIMIVENHQVTEKDDESPRLSISGRSLETILENRIVGQNQNWAANPASIIPYFVDSGYTWEQATWLINDHIVSGLTINAGDGMTLIVSDTSVSGTGVQEERPIKRGDLHKRVLEILEIDDLGIQVRRAHNFAGEIYPGNYTLLLIHAGIDKRNTVIFSSQIGDISNAEYLWSLKRLKNSALVSGKFVETMVYGTETGLNRRVMHVDGSDLDGHLTDLPTGQALTDIRTAMGVMGRQALQAQRELVLSRADVSENKSYRYRLDYNVGDIVAIAGSFGETLPMRVVEYAEIVDENGESGHPTLSLLEE